MCAPPQADRQYDAPPPHRLPKQPKDSFLVEQVFSPHPYPASLKAHLKNNPLYTDMRLTELAEVKRGQPSWTLEEYPRNVGDKGKLTALDLQVSFWLSPGDGWGGGAAMHNRCGKGQQWPRPTRVLPLSSWAPGPHGRILNFLRAEFHQGVAVLLSVCKHVAMDMPH